MVQNGSNGKTAGRLTAGLLGALIALQSVFVGLLVSHIQDRGIHNDQQYVTLAAYQADREHFQRSLEEIKAALGDIQKRLERDQRSCWTWPLGESGPDQTYLSPPLPRQWSGHDDEGQQLRLSGFQPPLE